MKLVLFGIDSHTSHWFRVQGTLVSSKHPSITVLRWVQKAVHKTLHGYMPVMLGKNGWLSGLRAYNK